MKTLFIIPALVVVKIIYNAITGKKWYSLSFRTGNPNSDPPVDKPNNKTGNPNSKPPKDKPKN